MLTRIRSVGFVVWLYSSIAVFTICGLPLLLMPRRFSILMFRYWSKCVLWGLRLICGVRVEFRGLEHLPKGACLIAGKHLSMLDTIAPFAILDDACFVVKKELTYLPLFGWFILKSKMVAVNRSDASKALRTMLSDTKSRLKDARQVLIFPEGTRSELNDPDPDYKPGVAALYRDLELPCTLMATNSGQFWPAHGIDRHPGTVVFEFMPALEAGLKRGVFMNEMKAQLESRSKALVIENTPLITKQSESV